MPRTRRTESTESQQCTRDGRSLITSVCGPAKHRRLEHTTVARTSEQSRPRASLCHTTERRISSALSEYARCGRQWCTACGPRSRCLRVVYHRLATVRKGVRLEQSRQRRRELEQSRAVGQRRGLGLVHAVHREETAHRRRIPRSTTFVCGGGFRLCMQPTHRSEVDGCLHRL